MEGVVKLLEPPQLPKPNDPAEHVRKLLQFLVYAGQLKWVGFDGPLG